MAVEKIQSFTVDHDKLEPGLYISRVDGSVTTYDLRTRKPNAGDYMDNLTMHSVEHLFATYVRNTPLSDGVVYVGPMGCRTGFYFLTRNTVSGADAIRLVQETLQYVLDFTGEIPGGKRQECGNYLAHDLEGAKAMAREYQPILTNWTPQQLNYPAEVLTGTASV